MSRKHRYKREHTEVENKVSIKDEHIKCSCKNDNENILLEELNNEVYKWMDTSETLPLCQSTSEPPKITPSPVIAKIPIVLAEPKITISLISDIKLEDDILEIKRIGKNIYLNQCKLIPNSGEDENSGILFISGLINKNIEYAIKESVHKGIISGKIKHTTVQVPFKCTTKVTFITKPIFTNTPPQEQVEIFENTDQHYSSSDKELFQSNICEQNLRFTEFFNEKVFCELVKAEIIESDILKSENDKSLNNKDENFFNLSEKVVLHLTIRLLQNQQVTIK